MRDNRQLKILVSALLLLGSMVFSSSLFASSHVREAKLRAKSPAIDQIITGANGGSLRMEHIQDNTAKSDDCPLCYHRNLLKKRERKGQTLPSQPYPVD